MQSKDKQMGWASMDHLLHHCWFPCKALLSADGRWASSSLARGIIYSAFLAGVFALPSAQQLEAPTYMKTTSILPMKKSERVW